MRSGNQEFTSSGEDGDDLFLETCDPLFQDHLLMNVEGNKAVGLKICL